MPNPFTIKVTPHNSPFCNRQQELEELTNFARNKTNVVLFFPIKFGKTPLIKRIQHKISIKPLIFLLEAGAPDPA